MQIRQTFYIGKRTLLIINTVYESVHLSIWIKLGRVRRMGGGGLVTKLSLTHATPWTVACQAPLSI